MSCENTETPINIDISWKGYCPNCFAITDSSWIYCPYCATDLRWNNAFSYYPTAYNYKCPDCKGEFNEPVNKGMAHGGYKCPFCGRKMGGI
jgi:DNA-directed RNA polymerase subunit RPC12/RpoP